MHIEDLQRNEPITRDEMSTVTGGAVAVWPIITDEVREANHVYDIITDEVRNAGIKTA